MKSYDIKKLAYMARIFITEEEGKTIEQSFESIIGYVDQIRELEAPEILQAVGSVYNVARDDDKVGAVTFSRDIILEDMPLREGDYLKVKKIL